ncbi:MAG: flagellar basal-body rod protein FlgF [Peptococcia bacterium]
MMRSLYTASSGMQAQQLYMDVIANNLANVNTTGFKKSRVEFQSLLYQSIRQPAYSGIGFFNPTGIEVGNGVRVIGTPIELESGYLEETSNPLNLAIQGDGYFMVHLPNGEVGYTRAGNFRLDTEGYLINAAGYRVLSSKGNANPTGGNVSVAGKSLKYIQPDTDTDEISISEEGIIATEKVDGANGPVIELATFTNPLALESIGGTLFKANEVVGTITLDQPTKNGLGSVHSGFTEGSNVQIVEEMVKMIMAQRAYEINSKSIQTSDDMMSLTNNLKR